MGTVRSEAWECGECGAAVSGEVLFAWCDGCSKVLCVACIDEATTCDACDTIVCRHCSVRAFALDCHGCGQPLHVDCSSRRGGGSHALCDGCAQSARAMWA